MTTILRSLQSYVSEETASYVFDKAVDGYYEISDHYNHTQGEVGEQLEEHYKQHNSMYHKIAVIVSNLMLFCLIFGLSATVNVTSLKRQFRNKFAVGTGIVMQFFIMPVLGFFSVVVFRQLGLTEAMGITLLVVTTSPGGSYSNWWCSTFNADLALSVAMTSFSTILSIAMLPANLMLYTFLAYGLASGGSNEEGINEMSIIHAVDFDAIFLTLGIVLSAILLGLSAGYKWDNPKFHITCNRMGTVCGIALILFSFFLSTGVGGAGDSSEESTPSGNFWSQPWSFYIGVAMPCLVGIVASNIIARSVNLPKPECVAISIECGYQNVGIATSVAVTMFTDPRERVEAISVPLFYGVIEGIVILFYCVGAWKMGWTKAPAKEKFCTVIMNTYEVEGDHTSRQDDDDHLGSQRSSDDPNQFPIIQHVETQEIDDLEAEVSKNSDVSFVVPETATTTPKAKQGTPNTPSTTATTRTTSSASLDAPRRPASSAVAQPWYRKILGRLGLAGNKNDYRTDIHHEDNIKKIRSDSDDFHDNNLGDFKRADRNRIVSEDYTAATSITSPSLTTPPATPELSANSNHANSNSTPNIPNIIYEESHSDHMNHDDINDSSKLNDSIISTEESGVDDNDRTRGSNNRAEI